MAAKGRTAVKRAYVELVCAALRTLRRGEACRRCRAPSARAGRGVARGREDQAAWPRDRPRHGQSGHSSARSPPPSLERPTPRICPSRRGQPRRSRVISPDDVLSRFRGRARRSRARICSTSQAFRARSSPSRPVRIDAARAADVALMLRPRRSLPSRPVGDHLDAMQRRLRRVAGACSEPRLHRARFQGAAPGRNRRQITFVRDGCIGKSVRWWRAARA